jgi:hypothetical protein
MQQRSVPGDGSTPIVADYDELLVTKCTRETGNVVGQFNDIVSLDRFRPITAAVAALVRNGDLETGFNQRVNLMTPEIPGLWKTMQENDQWPFSFDHSPQRDTVGRNTLKITLFDISLLSALEDSSKAGSGDPLQLFANLVEEL